MRLVGDLEWSGALRCFRTFTGGRRERGDDSDESVK